MEVSKFQEPRQVLDPNRQSKETTSVFWDMHISISTPGSTNCPEVEYSNTRRMLVSIQGTFQHISQKGADTVQLESIRKENQTVERAQWVGWRAVAAATENLSGEALQRGKRQLWPPILNSRRPAEDLILSSWASAHVEKRQEGNTPTW